MHPASIDLFRVINLCEVKYCSEFVVNPNDNWVFVRRSHLMNSYVRSKTKICNVYIEGWDKAPVLASHFSIIVSFVVGNDCHLIS